MRWSITSLCLFLFIVATFAKDNSSDNLAVWAQRFRILLRDCPLTPLNKDTLTNDFFQSLRLCLQNRALLALNSLLSHDIIPVIDGISLVSHKPMNHSRERYLRGFNNFKDNEHQSWGQSVLHRIAKVFKTHVLKIDVDVLSKQQSGSAIVEGRKRNKHNYNLMPFMAMGLLLMGSVLIPMGFQFLAVLGGKALLLAKMALLLSSIQGLKKVATNGMNYGFYPSPIPEPWHERSHSDLNLFNPPPPPAPPSFTSYHQLP